MFKWKWQKSSVILIVTLCCCLATNVTNIPDHNTNVRSSTVRGYQTSKLSSTKNDYIGTTLQRRNKNSRITAKSQENALSDAERKTTPEKIFENPKSKNVTRKNYKRRGRPHLEFTQQEKLFMVYIPSWMPRTTDLVLDISNAVTELKKITVTDEKQCYDTSMEDKSFIQDPKRARMDNEEAERSPEIGKSLTGNVENICVTDLFNATSSAGRWKKNKEELDICYGDALFRKKFNYISSIFSIHENTNNWISPFTVDLAQVLNMLSIKTKHEKNKAFNLKIDQKYIPKASVAVLSIFFEMCRTEMVDRDVDSKVIWQLLARLIIPTNGKTWKQSVSIDPIVTWFYLAIASDTWPMHTITALSKRVSNGLRSLRNGRRQTRSHSILISLEAQSYFNEQLRVNYAYNPFLLAIFYTSVILNHTSLKEVIMNQAKENIPQNRSYELFTTRFEAFNSIYYLSWISKMYLAVVDLKNKNNTIHGRYVEILINITENIISSLFLTFRMDLDDNILVKLKDKMTTNEPHMLNTKYVREVLIKSIRDLLQIWCMELRKSTIKDIQQLEYPLTNFLVALGKLLNVVNVLLRGALGDLEDATNFTKTLDGTVFENLVFNGFNFVRAETFGGFLHSEFVKNQLCYGEAVGCIDNQTEEIHSVEKMNRNENPGLTEQIDLTKEMHPVKEPRSTEDFYLIELKHSAKEVYSTERTHSIKTADSEQVRQEDFSDNNLLDYSSYYHMIYNMLPKFDDNETGNCIVCDSMEDSNDSMENTRE